MHEILVIIQTSMKISDAYVYNLSINFLNGFF